MINFTDKNKEVIQLLLDIEKRGLKTEESFLEDYILQNRPVHLIQTRKNIIQGCKDTIDTLEKVLNISNNSLYTKDEMINFANFCIETRQEWNKKVIDYDLEYWQKSIEIMNKTMIGSSKAAERINEVIKNG